MALTPVLSSAPNFSIDQGLEYYAGKTELLDWINHLLELNLTRLEQLTSGAVYCQIIDAFYADIVAIRKVNFYAREEYEILPNYKVLQAAFNALGLTKEPNVAKLSQASPPDLMEFAQWLYKSFKGVSTLSGYNPSLRRQLSVKGGTINVPLPACLVNTTFEFSRIDLRTSGNWGATTPQTQESNRGAGRANRSLGSTPGTGNKSSAGKRTPPYLNVASRYKDGLAVPPDHFERRSPRLSPGSTGGSQRKRVMVSHGSTQTDFPEEDYRPMTAADVGTEVSWPRAEQRDYGQQCEDMLVYTGSLSPSGSTASPSASAPTPHALGSETFSFGRSRSGIPSAPGIHFSPRTTSSPTTSVQLEEREPATVGASFEDDGRYGDNGSPATYKQMLQTPEMNGEVTAAIFCGKALDREDASACGAPEQVAEEGILNTFRHAAAAASFAETADTHGAHGEALPGAASASACAKENDEQDERSPDATGQTGSGEGAAEEDDLGAAGGDPSCSPSALPPRERLASPGVASSPAAASVAASPSPRAGQRWRNSPTVLPADVASLLASPVARTRLASPACLRDMAAALDVCAAALQAVDKALGSYDTLLTEAVHSPQPSDPSKPASQDAASALSCSPALCGKVRSLQDALQTLLEHTVLLLSDVQAYSQATHTTEQHHQPRSRTASPSAALEMVASPGRSAPAGTVPPGSPGTGNTQATRNFLAEAAVLLQRAHFHEDRLRTLSSRTEEVLKMPVEEPGATGGVGSPHPDRGTPASSGTAPQRHLTDEQRKLCSTAQLDSHLKAVGIAQFALVQDIHKELAALTATYFRHTGITIGGDGGSTGGGDGSTGGVSTGSSRKARVFKLGEYQLKQLRNGDIYKGRYVCNKKNGEGVYHFINADVFEGEFRDDRMDGHGVYTFRHEGRYEGQWRNAVYNGTGAETFAKGSTYHGEYTGGLRNGWGVCRFYNGDYYEGHWGKGLRDGSGMQQCTDDSNFVGDYQRGKRHGHGVYSFPNGDRYEGQYFEDLPHGHGTYHFASGQCYQGQWQQGKKHGWSVYTVDNGNRFMGLWSEGKPIWVQPLNGDAAAKASEDNSRSLQQALEARDLAVQAAVDARKRAASHWDMASPIQTRLRSVLSQAQASASLAQQARRKACDLAARLDAAVTLLR
ncbi:hypothetical protein VaNZ11_008378, partial [Volvox africanus]